MSPSRTATALSLAALLLIAGVVVAVAGANTPGPAGVTEVVLTARHSHWSTTAVHVRAGETVRFVVRNHDPIDHELIIGPPDVHARHATGTEAEHGTVPGEVSVPALSTAATTYRFNEPGVVAFGCHLPGHWDYGMHGIATVLP